MSPLKIIWDPKSFEGKKYRTRYTARAVLYDEKENIPLLYVGKYSYHKLPGGWVEAWENTEEALQRECLEEVGCEIEIWKYLWEVVEYRANIWWEEDNYTLQISKCYRWKIVKKWEANFTKSEKENDFSCRWVTLEEAIHILETDEPKNLEWRFIIERELTFLRSV